MSPEQEAKFQARYDAELAQEAKFRARYEQEKANSPSDIGYLSSLAQGLSRGAAGGVLGLQRLIGEGVNAIGTGVSGDWRDKAGNLSNQNILQSIGKGLSQDAATRLAEADKTYQPYSEANPWTAGGGKIAGEIISTLPVGGVLGKSLEGAAGAVGAGDKVAALANALRTSGMKTGTNLSGATLGQRAADLGIRSVGSAGTGAATAAIIDPEHIGTASLFGAAAPSAFKVAGAVASPVGRAIADKWNQFRGNAAESSSAAGRMLADALGLSEDKIPEIIAAARRAPESFVNGSLLTMAQALNAAGMKIPALSLLENTVAQGKGGNVLMDRYMQQAQARLEALRNQGAEIAPNELKQVADLAERTGGKIGATIRTQAADEAAANRAAWEKLDPMAQAEGTAIQLPLEEMKKIQDRMFGAGSFTKHPELASAIAEAEKIGSLNLPEITAEKLGKIRERNLEQEVRALGGIKDNGYLTGELQALRVKNSGTTGLINNKWGKSAEDLASILHERGYLKTDDSAELLDLLRNGGGRKIYAEGGARAPESAWQAMADAAAGDMPSAEKIAQAIPYDQFKRFRTSVGTAAANSAEKNPQQQLALNEIEQLLKNKIETVAGGGGRAGESMSPEFANAYNSARDMTAQYHQRYGTGPVAQILDKPYGQNYRLDGNEIMNKLWHGGQGLKGDVDKLMQALSQDNLNPTMDSLRKFIMTDAASRQTAKGELGAAFPAYVEGRMPALETALTPSQFNSLTSVARDIKNATEAAGISGLTGSDTKAKISMALDAGAIDSPIARGLAKLLTIKGVGGEMLQKKMAEDTILKKNKMMAELLSNPKTGIEELNKMVKNASTQDKAQIMNFLSSVGSKGTPLLATD